MIIREYKKEDLLEVSKIHVDSWKSTYSNIFPKDYLDSLTYDNQYKKWINRLVTNNPSNEFMLVAENDFNEIVAFSSAAKDSKLNGILFTLYIKDSYKNKGIGKSLIKEVAFKLFNIGANNLNISALSENLSCSFYEHLGAVKSEENLIEIGEITLKESIYKWNNLNYLLNI